MMSKRAQLNGKAILEKDFKTTMRGYSQEEVDEFLDIIIQDYDAFNQEIVRLQQEIEKLKKTTPDLQQTRTRATQQNTQVNYDVLKRLSNLEKEVFGKKFIEADE
ncbi:cell division regulator GpsB [Oceanobacillus sp. 143]|jgi:DivIVA domain-containing protein|uniref:Cell division regulator GpsB n=1 Tax=Oceanobacillus zhaokaii TaxID=2052660 RepID=A0A345PH39_9BACI|nr:cell division regulator GpsB [Oceanobacillus zhaokaii]AXI09319.1 cell division regulator GpsB [Oceanobacillus zhaokaii]QGS68801.1 cell division regulator GpsB [Oceanobacillus sp. 143]